MITIEMVLKHGIDFDKNDVICGVNGNSEAKAGDAFIVEAFFYSMIKSNLGYAHPEWRVKEFSWRQADSRPNPDLIVEYGTEDDKAIVEGKSTLSRNLDWRKVRCWRPSMRNWDSKYFKDFCEALDDSTTETPEEKEALDLIDTTASQVESLSDKPVEWKGGDPCIHRGIKCYFVGMMPVDKGLVGDCFIQYEDGSIKNLYLCEIKKINQTDERLEAAYDLFLAYLKATGDVKPVSLEDFTIHYGDAWLAIVDKTGYRKDG